MKTTLMILVVLLYGFLALSAEATPVVKMSKADHHRAVARYCAKVDSCYVQTAVMAQACVVGFERTAEGYSAEQLTTVTLGLRYLSKLSCDGLDDYMTRNKLTVP